MKGRVPLRISAATGLCSNATRRTCGPPGLLRKDLFVVRSWVPADSARGAGPRGRPRSSDLLLPWRDQIRQHADELSVLLTIEQGKPLAEAREGSHHGMAEFLELKYRCVEGIG